MDLMMGGAEAANAGRRRVRERCLSRDGLEIEHVCPVIFGRGGDLFWQRVPQQSQAKQTRFSGLFPAVPKWLRRAGSSSFSFIIGWLSAWRAFLRR